MGTRSRIVLDQRNNDPYMSNYISMYCHYDGYPEHTGKMLIQHYNSKQSAQDLIRGTMGYASSLYETPEKTRERSVDHDDQQFYRSLKDVIAKHEDSDIEFIYLFQAGEWYVSERLSVNCPNRFQGQYYRYFSDFQKLVRHPALKAYQFMSLINNKKTEVA